MSELTKLPTTTIERVPCCMRPDPCPRQDYRVRGVALDGDPFDEVVHHRDAGCWLIFRGELREQAERCSSLQEAIDALES